MSWETASETERTVTQLNLLKHEKLGCLLGYIDMVMLAEANPNVFPMAEVLVKLRAARDEFNEASQAYLDARMAI